MKISLSEQRQSYIRWFTAALAMSLVIQSSTLAFTLKVVDGANNPVANFNWLLEEDNTDLATPGIPRVDSPSLVIHKSHAPVIATGKVASSPSGTVVIAAPDTAKRYIVSVIADGYSQGGIGVPADDATATPPVQQSFTTVKAILNLNPIPTSQISVLVFHDNNSINNAPDATEAGLPGFRIVLADFAGGPILQDAFGNPLGTTYQFHATTGEPLYEPDGVTPLVASLGTGFIYTDANGKALIKYLPMGKFGVKVIPPTGQNWTGGHGSTPTVTGQWNQTSTIEGTKTVDAWVKANEPMIFMEGFGPGFYHVFFGFIDPGQLPWSSRTAPARAGATVTGTLRFNHFGRPPTNQMFVAGPPVNAAWVGLNEINALGAPGNGLYAAPCDPNTGTFSIPNVPPGTYQLVSWDTPLDALFGFNTIIVPAGATHNLGDVLCYRWFGSYEGNVFYDANQNGFRDAGEEGVAQQVLNLRWRDGTVYMSTFTDAAGEFAMTEVFPFFKWLVAEVDFARFKATGLTTVVDGGGGVFNAVTGRYEIPADAGWAMPSDNRRNPQPQYLTNPDGTQNLAAPDINVNTGNNLSRTETGPVLTQATHLFLNQNNRIDWGKVNYGPNENGGISGIVGYGTTRAEEDPRNAVIDPWEPGVPRVQVVLYEYDATAPILADTLDAQPSPNATVTRLKIKDVNGDGQHTLADVDNYPFGWMEGTDPRGPEDVDNNSNNVFDPGDALQIVRTDSWDDNPPTGTQQPNPPVITGIDRVTGLPVTRPIIGSDNYATWNQVRPGVFDGGYAFTTYFPGGMATNDVEATLPAGAYVVQAIPPPGYFIQTEESVNVVFGDTYKPSKLLLAPEIIGDYHQVGPILTLFPAQNQPAPFAGKWRPYADRKLVRLAEGKNAACDFHIYTEVPKATRVVGFVLNDLTAEFNASSPIFGEKGSPGWLPISFRDWAGHEVARVYCDEYGTYNALLPSTYTVNAPAPSGVAPNMLTLVLNDPSMPDPDPLHAGQRIPDPHYNPNFATTPWTLHYYPGTFLYADTPIVPIASFVGGTNKLVDVEPPAGTPVIKSVTGRVDPATGMSGPYVSSTSQTLTINSLGTVNVPDPNFSGYGAANTVPRDFGFGATQGAGSVTIDGTSLTILSWGNATITAQLPPGTLSPNAWQLMVTRDNGKTTPIGVTLTYDTDTSKVRYVLAVDPTVSPLATPIQDAIDAANPGDLVIVPVSPWDYHENPILYKPLRLQGSGVGTIIQANPVPAERLAAWHAKITTVLGGDPFSADESPGVIVLGQTNTAAAGADPVLADSGFATISSRIDGFQVKGSIAGGGILVFDRANNLRISNNRIIANQGGYSGGISLGRQGALGVAYRNPGLVIELNQILQNGGINGAGGIGIYTGATGYKIQNNYIMGNFTRGNGGGIGHQGLSPGGLIANNVIAFNEVFFGVAGAGAAGAFGAGTVAALGDGGGIYLTGELVPGGLGTGAGSVTIINNLIQGNLTGGGHGGGIRVAAFNGVDTVSPALPEEWYALDIFNNIIVNNMAGYSAGGISLKDATRVRIYHNTIANNDSAATARAAFEGGSTSSTAQGAGIVSHLHDALLTASSGQLFCNPVLRNNIIWHNRSFYFDGATQTLLPDPATPDYWDLQVSGSGVPLNPVNCILSETYAGGSGNIVGNPSFVISYVNTNATAIVADEAGNNLAIRFEPTGLYTPVGVERGNYHLLSGPPATEAGASIAGISELAADFDGEPRPSPALTSPDIGADEFVSITSLIPPDAPAITVAIVGPMPTTTPPGTATPPGPGVPPGPAVHPENPNPIPPVGYGTPGSKVNYVHLAAGDGFVTMADGNELYSFGFSDMTALALNTATNPALGPTQVTPQVMAAGMLNANFCAPTIVLKEGQEFHLDLSNVGMAMRPDLFDPHTVHFHGFPQAATIFDGEPMASTAIAMFGTLRYWYNIVEPGTFFYHCHVEATEHMEMGMIGNLWVEPAQNELPEATVLGSWTHHTGQKYAYNDGDGSTRYNVEAPIQLLAFDRVFHEQHILVQPLPFSTLDESYPMINGRGYPDTINPDPLTNSLGNGVQRVSSAITAQVGQRILLRISNVSMSDLHTLTVLGIPMRIVGKDARVLRGPDPDGAGPLVGKNLAYDTTSITLGGGESADAILVTTGLQPGTYFIYDARLNHLSNDEEDFGGMMTEITLNP